MLVGGRVDAAILAVVALAILAVVAAAVVLFVASCRSTGCCGVVLAVVVLPQSGVVGAAAYWFAWVFVVDVVAVVTVLAVVALLPLAAWRR